MTIAFVKKSAQSFGDSVTSFSASLSSVVAGNLVVVTIDKASGSDTTNPALAVPTPSGGWSVATATTGPFGTGSYRPVNAIFYKLSSAGGTETATWSGTLPGDTYIEATISEYSCTGTWAFDASASNVGDSASPGSVSGISNSTAVALAIAVVGTDANSISNLVGPSTGYTQIDISNNNSVHNCYGSGYKILSATGAQSATWTWTTPGPWMGSLAIFREVAGGGPTSYTITPSGGVTVGGTIPQAHGRGFVVSGGVTFSGTAPIRSGIVITPSGGVTMGGTTTISHGRAFVPSGAITFSGTVPLIKTNVVVPSGLLTLSGTAPISYNGGTPTTGTGTKLTLTNAGKT